MVNAKVKIINDEWPAQLEVSINTFLETIDIRQIIKTEYSTLISSYNTRSYSVIIYYIGLEDIRDIKISNILEAK